MRIGANNRVPMFLPRWRRNNQSGSGLLEPSLSKMYRVQLSKKKKKKKRKKKKTERKKEQVNFDALKFFFQPAFPSNSGPYHQLVLVLPRREIPVKSNNLNWSHWPCLLNMLALRRRRPPAAMSAAPNMESGRTTKHCRLRC